MTYNLYKCWDCKHYAVGLRCKAYPKGISEDVLIKMSHDKVIKGQTGEYIFEPENSKTKK